MKVKLFLYVQMLMYLPNIQLIDLATKVEQGAGFGDVFSNLLVIIIWVVVVYILTAVMYKKRMVD